MRQVPAYLLIGNGRVSRHFQHYFSLLNIPFLLWQRSNSTADLQQKIARATHILLLISDHAIEQFIADYLPQQNKIYLHFSGSLVSKHAFGVHPLMTFSEKLYSLAQYQTIPFVIDEHAPTFEELFPQLPNQHVRLPIALKTKYHALCALSGNFTCLLWQKLFTDFAIEMNLPPAIAHPYLLQQMQNLIEQPEAALTGPLARNDWQTIEKHLNVLQNDPFRDVYQSFVTYYQQLKRG